MHLVMKLSKLCNLRCTYCYEYAELANKERMPIESIDHFFNSVAQNVLKRGNNVPVDLILHGGEPLLLPREYLRAVGALREKHFTSNGITNTVAVQSNLFSLPEATLDLLGELDIQLGMSLDVFGNQRCRHQGTRLPGQSLEQPAARPRSRHPGGSNQRPARVERGSGREDLSILQ